MKTRTKLIMVLTLGSAWGIAEIFGKDLLAELGLHGASVWLAVWAIVVLSMARGAWNKIGSSTLIGLVAAGIRFAGPTTSACHLLGIASIGLVFDLFASSLAARESCRWWRYSLVGVLTAFGARTVFVLYAIHVAHLDRWVEGGAPMAVEHVVRGGSIVAAAALLLAPIAFLAGRKLRALGSATLSPELAPEIVADAAKRD